MTSKHHGDFYCFNYLHSFRTENKLKSHEKYVKIEIFVELHCYQKRKFNQYVKSDKMSDVMLRKRLY